MENCLKRRDHNDSSDMGDGEDGDFEGNFQECFLSKEKSRSHEYECCLISPYKRLRVEELTHSSVESQTGEGEAHSCLRSSDEAEGYDENSFKARDYRSYGVTSDLVSDTEDSSQIKTSQNLMESAHENKHGSLTVSQLVTVSRHPNPGKLTSSKLTKGRFYQELSDHDNKKSSRVSKTDMSSRKDATSFRMPRDSDITPPHGLYPASTFGRHSDTEGRVPKIDEICMEESCTSSTNTQFPVLLASEHTTTSSEHMSCDQLSLTSSHHKGLQHQSSKQIYCRTNMTPLDVRPIKSFSQHLLLANDAPADSRTIRCTRSVDLLEIHAGNVGTSEDECPNVDTASWQSSWNDKEALSGEDQDHYQTIDDVEMTTAVSSSKHREAATTASSISAFVDDNRDCHSNRKTPETTDNKSNYLKVMPARSIGTSCSNIPSHARKTRTTTTADTHESSKNLLYWHGSANQDYKMEPACGDEEAGNVASSLLQPTTHSGMSQAASCHEQLGYYKQGLRYSSHQELPSSSLSVDTGCVPRVAVCATSSWDNVHLPYQEQHQQRQERQYTSGSYQASSVQSYNVEELQVDLPGTSQEEPLYRGGNRHFVSSSSRSSQEEHGLYRGDSRDFVSSSRSSPEEHDLYLGGNRKFVSSSSRSPEERGLYLGGNRDFASSSRSSQCSSRGDSHYQSYEGSQNQHHSGTSQNNSAGSVDQKSVSSQGSTDQINKSYPSSLIVSGNESKKAVLQSSGHLRIAAYWNVGLLTIHVIQARCLSSSWKSQCCSYVKMSLVPDESRRTRCKTRIQVNTNHPMFDEKFSLEILEEDQRKRLLISVWHKDPGNGASEFLGCMSFGVGHLLKRDLDGWYYLLTEEVGRKKHLQANNKSRPVLTARNYQNVPQINRAVDRQERITITIARGKNGFGFSFVEEFPPKVGRVDRASPAEHAGVMKGDMVIKVNGQNVSRSTCDGVAHLIKKMNPSTLRLELLRDQHIVSTTTEITATGCQHPHDTSPYNKRGVGTSTDNLYESIEDRSCSDHYKENRAVTRVCGSFEEEYLTEDDLSYSQNSLPRHQRVTSTPRLFVGPWHKAVNAAAPGSLSKHESIHRLMSLELEYIDFMHFGIERYSRPLRHSILSAHHHMIVFQNVEKLVTISEYHIKQMQENNSSINSDTDDSQSSESSMFPNSIALIYHSKIHMLSQAYEDYASGLSKSNTLLRELRKIQDFMNFIREPDFTDEQCADHPSISAFINRPVQHIQELYAVLSEVFSATPIHSPDFANLQQIVIKLSQCISAITGLNSAGRVESLDSLVSSQGKGSTASLSSTCSSSEADVHYPLVRSSAASRSSIDKDVKLIQKKLVFSPNVQGFQLLQEGRHLIYRGEIYRHSKGLWFKSQLILFSDILLLVSEEPDGSLCVTNKPVRIQDLTGIEVHRKYVSEFVLYLRVTTSTTLPRRQQLSSTRAYNERSKTIILRAPSSQEKFMWKTLIEQRVTTLSGSTLHHYGSARDISHVKTSIIL